MKVFVLGAGRMGSAIAADLGRSKDNIEIGVGDIDLPRAQAVASSLDNAKAFKVDVSKVEDLERLLKGFDVAVNASWYEYNLQVMDACFRAGCNYNDLGGLFHMTRQQLKLNNEAKRAGISAVVGGGESPGITNIMCYLASESLSAVDTVKIFVGASEGSQSNGKTKKRRTEKNSAKFYFPFSISTMIDEYSKNPVEFIDGRYIELPPLSGNEVMLFPSPVGANTCHYSLHSEPATLPRTIGKGTRNVEFKLGVSEAMLGLLRPLIEIGLTSEEEIQVDGGGLSPRKFLVSFFNSKAEPWFEQSRNVAIRVKVRGSSGTKTRTRALDMVCGSHPATGVRNATAYMTGTAGSIFGQFLAKGKVKRTGVLAPEEAVDPREFLSELSARGLSLATRVSN